MDLVVTIMIKNEETSICPTLQPFIDDGFVNFLIYDTGSTDNTVKVVRDFLTLQKKTFHIVEEKWIDDFAYSRNRCMDHAKKLFPDCRFNVHLDCEWFITNSKKIIEFCAAITNPEDAYHIYIQAGNSFYGQKRLFKNHGNARYEGETHEYVSSSGNGYLPRDVFFTWRPNQAGSAKTNLRWYRDLSILLKKFDANKEPRSCFYLAQTYASLGDDENAIRYYKIRADLVDGFFEERFIALYRIAQIYQKTDWDMALAYYLKAYEYRPSRIEPLVKIAMHYSNTHLKYLFARQACAVGYPTQDFLFIEDEMYNYHRWDQLSIGAWWVGAFEEGYAALLKAREIHPTVDHIITNHNLYREKLFPEEVESEKMEQAKTNHPARILNLILHSIEGKNAESYKKMYSIQSAYLKEKKIDHYFYCYRRQTEEFIIEDDILYIRGEETFLPGILDKTLSAFAYFSKELYSKYDYIVRSNISTCINFDLLKHRLKKTQVDYSGPLFYISSPNVNDESGLNAEKHAIYGKYGFVSGVCIIMSALSVVLVLGHKDIVKSYGLVDDIAIGVCINSVTTSQKAKFKNFKNFKIDGEIQWNKPIFEPSTIAYRNRSEDDRENDIENVKITTQFLLDQLPDVSPELNIFYQSACKNGSDINEHVQTLRNLATSCKSVFEIGISRMEATWGFLHGLKDGSTYISTNYRSPNKELLTRAKILAAEKEIKFSFICKGDNLLEIEELEPVEMMFVDGLHTYCHVTYQLEKFSPLVSKYIAFHDTSEPWGDSDDTEYRGDYSEYPETYDKTKRGVWPAVVDFLVRHPEWTLKEKVDNNHGFAVIEKC